MCGIFGFIGKQECKIDKTTLNLLGIMNDRRGGDSCGIFIDGEYEYGVDKFKLYEAFMYESKLLEVTNKARVVLGHCRKASVGGISETTAQPIVIKNEDGDVDFVLIHNGTILNYKALYKEKLGINAPCNKTDSQIMAEIFYKKGYDVLKEYEGAGAFVMADYRKRRDNPDVFFFKGNSLYNCNAKDTSDERPLFVVFENDKIWFSSIASSLKAARYPATVYDLKENTLYKYTPEKSMVKVRHYDRKVRVQTWASYTEAESWDYDRDCDYNRWEGAGSRRGNSWVRDERGVWKEVKAENKGHANNRTYMTLESVLRYGGSALFNDKVSYTKDGRFYGKDNVIMHGGHILSYLGYNATKYNAQPVYFFNGYLVAGESAFDVLSKLYKESGIEFEDYEHFTDLFPELIRKYGAQPWYNVKEKRFEIEEELGNPLKYSGDMIIPFSTQYIQLGITNGEITTYRFLSVKNYEEACNNLISEIDMVEYDTVSECIQFDEYMTLAYGEALTDNKEVN